jgi:hypothetical protein
MTPESAKYAWQTSVAGADQPALDEVRAGAAKLHRFVRRRNVIEYAACVLAAAVFAIYVLWLPHPLQKLGSALVVLATLFAARQLHVRASAVAPESAGTMPILAFARTQLERQRDALRSIFWWYLLPFLPGLVLVIVGSASARAGGAVAVAMAKPIEWIAVAIAGVLFAGIWWLNQRIADKLQRRIDEIDALTGDPE